MLQLRIITSAAVIAGLAGTANAALLSDLVDNDGSIVVGDKLFSDFTYLATGDMPKAENVNVIQHVDNDGNVGIRFQGAFLDLPGNGGSDALITFNVTVLDPNFLISGAHLSGNLDVVGGSGGGSFGAITETFLTDNTTDSLTIFATESASVLADWVTFSQPVATLEVQKDILLITDVDAVATTLSFVDQTFSQVPEPGSLALIALGGLALLRRRR